MLERDGSNEPLRVGGSTQKEERKKPHNFAQRKMTYQQPTPELMDDSLLNMPDDLEQLDQILESLSIEIQSFGLPDCGNLRSTKRKDVKMRIKCF